MGLWSVQTKKICHGKELVKYNVGYFSDELGFILIFKYIESKYGSFENEEIRAANNRNDNSQSQLSEGNEAGEGMWSWFLQKLFHTFSLDLPRKVLICGIEQSKLPCILEHTDT